MKSAIIYARYSSASQTEQSIEGQLHVCNQYAKANDLIVVDTYIDRATTGERRFSKCSRTAKLQYGMLYWFTL